MPFLHDCCAKHESVNDVSGSETNHRKGQSQQEEKMWSLYIVCSHDLLLELYMGSTIPGMQKSKCQCLLLLHMV